jgi:hypothetical protein
MNFNKLFSLIILLIILNIRDEKIELKKIEKWESIGEIDKRL